jgi:hypothetical protein
MHRRTLRRYSAIIALALGAAIALLLPPWMAYLFWIDLGHWLWEGMVEDGLIACAGGITLAAVITVGWLSILYNVVALAARLWQTPRGDDDPDLPPPPRRLPPEPNPVPVGGGPLRPRPLVARARPPAP